MTRDRPGVCLGVDVGKVRVGVAVSDPYGILATPLVTLARGQGDLPRLAALVREYEAVAVIVGLPVNLRGLEGPAAADSRNYAESLAQVIAPVPVQLSDERMSTVLASRRLSEQGVRGRRQKAVVDQAAAVEILQVWLDSRRRRTT
ncbi:MAG TPA: Holliday junction resolvase RuvX [Rugosimonospora sp.]|nr:Holliday junction resolvase RuvX [Rugosimonospora sp.]